MEMTERHKKAILDMFVDSLRDTNSENRKKKMKDFTDSFMVCFRDFNNAINTALKERSVSDDIIKEWNDFLEERQKKEAIAVEICPMELKDEDEIIHLLIKEIELIPQLSEFSDTGTVREYAETGFSFVAKKNGVIVGVMMAQKMMDFGNDCVFINNFAVESSFQGQGIGAQMMNHLEYLTRKNCKSTVAQIMLCTNKNRKAYDIYHKWGFSDQGPETVYLSSIISTDYERGKE